MRLFVFIICVAIAAGQVSDGSTYFSCDYVSSFPDCNLFISDSYCGTNRVTYNNKCEFSRAHCADPSVNLLHVGDCTSADNSTSKPVDGAEVVYDFFCNTLSKQDCPVEISKVCGTDGWTYINYCEYEKARCTHRNLDVAFFGDCGI